MTLMRQTLTEQLLDPRFETLDIDTNRLHVAIYDFDNLLHALLHNYNCFFQFLISFSCLD